MTRVFVLDDHDVVRRGLKELLQDSGDIEVVGEASTAGEARSGIPLAEPDVAVLDVRLSDGSGVEVCREIRSRHPEIKCVMLSAFDDEVAIVESILAGASGYVLKQIKGGDIVNAVRMVASGESLFEPALRVRVLDDAATTSTSRRATRADVPPATVTRPGRGRP
jgi:two-component system, NarL family, response regulator DevR